MCKYIYQYILISISGKFDKEYYLRSYPDIRESDTDPLMHYIRFGWKEGRNPSKDFDTSSYLLENPNIEEKNINPLLDFHSKNRRKFIDLFQQLKNTLRDIYVYIQLKRGGEFDQAFYLRTNPDVRQADINPLMHYIRHGWKEGRNPSPLFFTEIYLEYHQDVKNSQINPLLHYQKYGRKEGRYIYHLSIDESQLQHAQLSSHDVRMKLIDINANHPPTAADIIIFPIIDWDFRYQRPQHLASQLAEKGHRIFYIHSNFQNKNAPIVEKIKDNIFSVNLSCEDPDLQINTHLSDRHVKDLSRSIQLLRDHFLINSATILVDLPFWQKLAIHLKRENGWKLIFNLMDHFSEFSNCSPFAKFDENRLLSESDCVIATSEILFRFAKDSNEHTILLPNGTDFEHFHKASNPIPSQGMKRFSSPIIGYYGAIADWFDTELVGKLAERHPEWTFVLIGDTELSDLAPLKGRANIHLLGEKPYDTLPGFLSCFDVTIIPFKDNPLTNATNPVKLYEYLSAGKSVVATNLEELRKFSDYIKLAETIEDWETAIHECLTEERTRDLIEKCFSFAKKNTWEIRGDQLEKILIDLFPKISIIVVTYNNYQYSRLCLESILQNTSYPNYEIVVVDNASTDDTLTYIHKLESKNNNVSVISNKNNEGFPKANNQGVRQAQGDYILFLNNDTIVTPGWVHRLFIHLRNNPKAGMVGPVTNAIANEAQIDVTYKGWPEINAFAAHRLKNHFGESFEIKVLALYCTLISKDLLEKVNGLDERYETGLFEDDDLAMKIKQEGYILLCAEDVFIHHFSRMAFKQLEDETYQNLFNKNRKRFEEKWGVSWEPHKHRQSE